MDKQETKSAKPELRVSRDCQIALVTKMQIELMKMDGIEDTDEEANQKALEWVESNSPKFREIFEEMLARIQDDPRYGEIIIKAEAGYTDDLVEAMLPEIRTRMMIL
ncbi:MAG: hypothetical protein WC518_01535 [Patescibacteria group bacterium]